MYIKVSVFSLCLISSSILQAQNFIEIMTPFAGVKGSSVAISDIDLDGDIDVFISGSDMNDQPISKLYLNDGNANFQENEDVPFAGVFSGSVVFADVNNDNSLDLFITGANNDSTTGQLAELYINQSNGTFIESLNSNFEAAELSSAVFFDVENDSDQDLIITGDNYQLDEIIKLYINDGLGNFTEILNTPFKAVRSGSVTVSDIDNDNDQDVFITGLDRQGQPSSNLYINEGNRSFRIQENSNIEIVYRSINLFNDIDSDNDQDLIISGIGRFNEKIAKIYLNDGFGNFTEDLRNSISPVDVGSFSFADIDGDLDNDLFITGDNSLGQSVWGNHVTKLYLNNGFGVFTEATNVMFENVGYSSIATTDFNGDNLVDLLITGYNNVGEATAKLYLNKTDITSNTNDLNKGNLELSIFPNPNQEGILHLSFKDKEVNIKKMNIYNSQGTLLIDNIPFDKGNMHAIKVKILDLTDGVYFLEIITNNYKEIRKFEIFE